MSHSNRPETADFESEVGAPLRRRRMAGYTELRTEPTREPTGTSNEKAVAQPRESDSTTPATQGVAEPHVEVVENSEQTAALAPTVASETVAPGPKRRMAGAPKPKTAQPSSSDAPMGPQRTVLPAETSAPIRARRMGAPVESPALATQEAEVPAKDQAPVRRKRMGSSTAGAAVPTVHESSEASPETQPSPQRTRMGPRSAAAAPPDAEKQNLEAAAAPVARQRMGGAPTEKPTTVSPPVTESQTVKHVVAETPNSGKLSSVVGKSPKPAWVRPALVVAGLVVIAVVVVLGARWLRTLESVQEFIATYDGHASQLGSAPEGNPWWMGWQHFFNMFFMVLIVRTGLQVRTERKPPGYWTAKKDSFFSPRGNTPKKVSLTQWLHQALDVVWVANGLIFIVMLFATGQWKRIVPTSWDIIPNMLSGAVQYASLNWPTENGWIHYNALQVTAYFITVFIAAPLAILSGVRFSTWWPERFEKLSKVYPVEWARAVHIPVMLYFVAFTIVHVFLVFFTGALRNLNHMYTSRDVADWWGLLIFVGTMIVIAAGWFLSKPLFTTPIATKMGKVTR